MQEILKGLPRGSFNRLVAAHHADKHSKGFRCWDQLVAMIYGQLSGVSSLRQLEAGFNSQSSHHYHLGTRPVRRSTLAEANRRRRTVVFEQTARLLEAASSTILADDIVRFTYRRQGKGRSNRYEKPLRRIVTARPDKDRPLILATNDLNSPALDIARCDKDRWQIELFFKWMNQTELVDAACDRASFFIPMPVA